MMWSISLPYDDPIFEATVNELCFNRNVAFDIFELEEGQHIDTEVTGLYYYVAEHESDP